MLTKSVPGMGGPFNVMYSNYTVLTVYASLGEHPEPPIGYPDIEQTLANWGRYIYS